MTAALLFQILWTEFSEDDEIFIITVDGIDCRIREPRKIPSTHWYSHKFGGPGLTYELGIAIHQQKLVWIRGPEPSGKGDLQNFRAPDGLKSRIPLGKKVVADSSSGTNRFEPSVLRETRPEYKVFPLKVFRDHIYQEARMKTGSSYWMNKAKEKKLTKTAPTTKPSSTGASSG
jgi:hypothetical protein